jgi:hypothetical protein
MSALRHGEPHVVLQHMWIPRTSMSSRLCASGGARTCTQSKRDPRSGAHARARCTPRVRSPLALLRRAHAERGHGVHKPLAVRSQSRPARTHAKGIETPSGRVPRIRIPGAAHPSSAPRVWKEDTMEETKGNAPCTPTLAGTPRFPPAPSSLLCACIHRQVPCEVLVIAPLGGEGGDGDGGARVRGGLDGFGDDGRARTSTFEEASA